MKKFFCIVLCTFMLLPLMACKNKKNDPQNQTILYNLDDDPKTLDPQIAEDIPSLIVITNIFEGLTKIDENNNVVPAFALSWEHNNDYSSYTFHLKKDGVWSNDEKTPVVAGDFAYGIKRAINPQTKSTTAKDLFCIKNAKEVNSSKMSESDLGIEVKDDYTITFELEYSYEDFPRIMSKAVSMPCNKDFFESTNGKYGLDCSYVLSNGPFKIRQKYGWDHDKNLYILNNENYNGNNKAIPLGVTFSIKKDTSNDDMVQLISKGKTDAGIITEESLEKAKDLKFNMTSFKDTTWVLCFNFTDDTFKNSNIRESFVTSFSRDYVLKNFDESRSVANDIILDTATINGKNYRSLVEDNLYLKQDDDCKTLLNKGLKQIKLKSLPDVTIICTDDSKTKSIVSSLLEEWNKNLGYYFNMQPVSAGKLCDTMQLGQYQVALSPITVKSDDPIEPLSYFRTNNKNNLCDMKDSYYDKLLDQALNADISKKAQACLKAEKYLNDTASVYPMFYESKYFASSPKVSGIIFYNNLGTVNFINAKKIK